MLDRTLIWDQRHLMSLLREYENFYNTHRPHRALNQAAPLRPLPDGVAELGEFRVQRRDRAGGVIPVIWPGGVGFRHPQVQIDETIGPRQGTSGPREEGTLPGACPGVQNMTILSCSWCGRAGARNVCFTPA